MSFKDKVIIVTGASSGIGESIALCFSKVGVNVVLTARKESELHEVSVKIKQNQIKCLVIPADLTKDEDIKSLIRVTVDYFGRIDVLINNAGIAGSESILSENAMLTFDQMIATNLRPAVYLTYLAAPYLIKTKDNNINMSSVGACTPLLRENFAYCTSKSGLNHFTKCVALELASKGVRANTVNTGPAKTNFMDTMGIDEASQEEFWNGLKKGTALGKIANPEEISDLVMFLASDKANSITGVSRTVDNGVLLKGFIDIN